MNIDHYKQLESLYTALWETPSYDYTAITDRVEALRIYIHQNGGDLAADLSSHTEHTGLYKDMTENHELRWVNVRPIVQNAELLQWAATPDKLVKWLGIENPTPKNLLMALETLKKKAEYEPVVSKLAIIALGLGTRSQVTSLFNEREMQLIALAHFVNVNKIPLKELNLSIDELNFIAPHLHFVDCRDIAFHDSSEAENFVKNCSTAKALFINSDKIKALNELTNTIQTIDCSNCEALETLKCPEHHNLNAINCSNCKALQTLQCDHCRNLTKVDFSNCQALQGLYCSECPIKELSLSSCGALKELFCYECPIKELDCSNCYALEALNCCYCTQLKQLMLTNCRSLHSLYCSDCRRLETLNISDCEALFAINCCSCTMLRELNCSNSQVLDRLECQNCPNLIRLRLNNCRALRILHCSNCSRLETIASNGLPNCEFLEYSRCPNLRQLPQLPRETRMVSQGSIDYTSFWVDPDKLNTHPLQMLCSLGSMILRDKRMPNIVFVNSPGVDAGGLRRQLVTTLMQNLFERSDSPLTFLRENGVEGVLPLLGIGDEQQNLAYKTIGALIALAAKDSLPLGRFLRSNFFYTLLNLENDDLRLSNQALAQKIYSLTIYGDLNAEVTEKELEENPIALPIVWAAAGFREIADPKKFREMPLNDFVTQVEGLEVTWENFNKVAVYTKPELREYFRTFFEKKPQKICDMIELFTASRTLGKEPIKIITLDKLDKGKLFSIETCFQQVTLPPYDTYELFEEKLLKTIEYTLNQFGKA